ncbi:nesprin-1-like [Spea bombifrons]|uniref:nesprin-1-like n=1 Tax=Spea bombifrons TaxID=233779 RepID=UPI0023495D80|nr:nesprin-1-like [Spea bombifrons]
MEEHLSHFCGEEDGLATGGIFTLLPSSDRSLSLIVPKRSETSATDTPSRADSVSLECDHHLSGGLETAVAQVLPSDVEGHQQEKNDFLQAASESSSLKIQHFDKVLDSRRFYLQQTKNATCCKIPARREPDPKFNGYLKLLRECQRSIDTVRKVRDNLKEEDEAFPGLANLNSTETKSAGVIERWELFQAEAKKEDPVINPESHHWQQFMPDLTNIWDWLGDTEEEIGRVQQLDVGTDIQTVNVKIKRLKELQKALDTRKPIVLSINLWSSRAGNTDNKELQEHLSQMNVKWGQVCSSLDGWRCSLQEALMQCQEFHETSQGLLLWLENIDRRQHQIIPIDPNCDSDTLQQHHLLLMQMKSDLLESELKVPSLKNMSCELLVKAEGTDSLEAKERAHVISNRLKFLLKEVTIHVQEIENILGISTNQPELTSWSPSTTLDTSGSFGLMLGRRRPLKQRMCKQSSGKCVVSEPGPRVIVPPNRSKEGSCHQLEKNLAQQKESLIRRVLLTAFPLQFLLLLIIILAFVATANIEHHSCTLANNFARSFNLMVRYTNGPPPI